MFEGIPASVRRIQLLELSLWTPAAGYFKVEYPGAIPIAD